MRRLLHTMIVATALIAALPSLRHGQKKQAQCETSSATERNWEQIDKDYVYFAYVLCPGGLNPPQPLVRVWLTTRGDGFAVEKWSQNRNGADSVTVFNGKKKAYTIYRDLDAIPFKLFKAESREGVPAETAKQPFFLEGTTLIPLENLTADSIERINKVFVNADALIGGAERKASLLHDAGRIAGVVGPLASPPKAQK